MYQIYDMGYIINLCIARTESEYEAEYGKLTEESADKEWAGVSPEAIADDAFQKVKLYFKGQMAGDDYTVAKGNPAPDNIYCLCYDDKSSQLRPTGYKHRHHIPLHAKAKSILNDRLLKEFPISPCFKRFTGLGMEADDWAYSIRQDIRNGKTDSPKDAMVHYITTDRDWLCNIDSASSVELHWGTNQVYVDGVLWDATEGHVVSDKFTCPYNAVWLYKRTVGDASDSIPGINKFGPKAFETLCSAIRNEKGDEAPEFFRSLSNFDVFNKFVLDGEIANYLPDKTRNDSEKLKTMLEQMKGSWNLVRPFTEAEAKEIRASLNEAYTSFSKTDLKDIRCGNEENRHLVALNNTYRKGDLTVNYYIAHEDSTVTGLKMADNIGHSYTVSAENIPDAILLKFTDIVKDLPSDEEEVVKPEEINIELTI